MKKNLLWFFGLALVASFAFSNCADNCKDVDCGGDTKGSCFDGACVCNQGFEGTNCETTWAVKYVGTWTATEVCKDSTGAVVNSTPYTATVTEVSSTKINVKNVSGFGVAQSIDFELTESGKITMTGTDNQSRVFAGDGVLGTDGKIVVDYTVTYTDKTKDSCKGTWSK